MGWPGLLQDALTTTAPTAPQEWPGTPLSPTPVAAPVAATSEQWPGTPSPTATTEQWPGTPQTQASKPYAATRGVISGYLKEQPELFGHALEGLSHLVPESFRETLRSGSQSALQASKEMLPEQYKAENKGFWNSFGSIGDALTWAGETFGSGVASTTAPLVVGAAGAAAGSAVAPGVGTITGGLIGSLVGGSPLNYGEVYKALKDEKVPEADAARYAAYVTPLMAALDTAGIAMPALRLLGASGVKQELTRGIARRIAVEATKGLVGEGGTEAAQKAVELGTVSLAANKPFLTQDTVKAIVESAVGGALVGAPFGAVAGVKKDAPSTNIGAAGLEAALGIVQRPGPEETVATAMGVAPTQEVTASSTTTPGPNTPIEPPSQMNPAVVQFLAPSSIASTSEGPRAPPEFADAKYIGTNSVGHLVFERPDGRRVVDEPKSVFAENVLTPNRLARYEITIPSTVNQNMPAMQEVKSGTFKSTPGANTARLARLLGPKLYGEPTDMAAVSVKEMVQNSFDAIKGSLEKGAMTDGNIDIRMDLIKRTITVGDDGVGMTPEVLGKEFLQVAGTSKESSSASGGLGIAKMLFLFGNKSLSVKTMRNGKVAEMRTTGEQLFGALDDPNKAPNITVRNPTAREMQTEFRKGHGTIVMVSVPDSFKDPSSGEDKMINFDSYHRNHKVLTYSPLFRNISVMFNGVPLDGMGTAFPADRFTQFANVNFKWGSARIYVSKKPVKTYGQNLHVLSNGLWQFSTKLSKSADTWDEPIQRAFYLDVNPKVRAEDVGYPFDLNRQQFSKQAGDDFKKIFDYMSLLYQNEDFQDSVKNFGDIQYLQTGPDGKVLASKRIKVEPKIPVSDNALKRLQPGDNVEVKDGKLIVAGRAIPELTKEDIESFKINFDELKIDQSEINPDLPMVHDNVNVTISGGDATEQALKSIQMALAGKEPPPFSTEDTFETRSIVELGRERFGARFETFLHDLGARFIELRNVVADAMTTKQHSFLNPSSDQVPYGTPPADYSAMKKEATGISFDREYRGVSIRVPFAGFFINPAAPEYRDSLRAGLGIVGTMIHELAHHKVRSHDANFPAEMQRILIALDAHPTFDIKAFKQSVVNTMSMNDDIAQLLYGVLDGSLGPISPRGKRFEESSYQQIGDGGGAGVVAAPGGGSVGPPNVPTGSVGSAPTPPEESRPGNVSASLGASSSPDNGRSSNAAAYAAVGEDPSIAVPIQPETKGIRSGIASLFGGNTPPQTKAQAAHADRYNWFYKWLAGLDQLARANPNFRPIIEYMSGVKGMHLEESLIHEMAHRIGKDLRRLRGEGDRVAGFFHELVSMSYRSSIEVAQGISRHPSQLEREALLAKWKISRVGSKESITGEEVIKKIELLVDGFLNIVHENAVAGAKRSVMELGAQQKAIAALSEQLKAIKSRPWYPFMRFGSHYVMIKDARGNLLAFETYERQGLRSAAQVQANRVAELNGKLSPGDKVESGILPESVGPLIGMPPMLLENMKHKMLMTPEQLASLPLIQFTQQQGYVPILNPKYQRKFYVPGYSVEVPGRSMDFKRSLAKYFFHGAKFHTKTKYLNGLEDIVAQAERIPDNKANQIARYMRDHLENTVKDARGDFGIFKAGIFIWAMGYVPAAATQNLSQTPMITFPYLAAKFGGLGVGDVRASKAIAKALVNWKNFYKRGYYDKQLAFEMKAMAYGIKTGRISETQSADLAGMSQANNLLLGIGGNAAQRGWLGFQEKAAWMFEMAEQVNRRVAFQAALDLAMHNPKAKFIDQAVKANQQEYDQLIRENNSVAEARAIITASYVVEETQYVYSRWARPRFMRGRLPGTLFVFKKYMQSTLWMLANNRSDVLPRYLLVAAFIGGLGNLPGMEDLRGILKALGSWLFGKNFDINREARKYILQFSDGRVDPDLILHGMARRGMGIPALLDLGGSFATGTPGRGLAPPRHVAGVPSGFAQNVPFPVLDRSKALGMGLISPVDFGAMATPTNNIDKVLAEQTQKASGAVFSVGFNIYKAIMDNHLATSDWKRWERAVPRQLGAMSKSWRAFSEGRERSKGGPNAGTTIVSYDPNDTEQMMEALALGTGYQPLRVQARWDSIMAKMEVEKFYDLQKKTLLEHLFEAHSGKNPKEIEDVVRSIREYNDALPEEARGMKITSETAQKSVTAQYRGKVSREAEVPTQKSKVPISWEMNRLFPEATIDVRRR